LFLISKAQRPQSTQSGVWLGLNDLSLEGKYVWSNGITANFTNWYQGQPSSKSADEDCVTMVTGNGNDGGKWIVKRCGEKNTFVCWKMMS